MDTVRIPWISAIGASYATGVDGISLSLVLLTGIVAIACVLMSWNVDHRAKEFFALLLLLVAGVYGVFVSLDLFLLFAFYELAIIPKYFMIAVWGSSGGSTNRESAAMRLVLYSFVGSALVFAGLLVLWTASGAQTFDLLALKAAPLSTEMQFWCFPVLFIGFAVLAGMWPFHSWAPTGHSAAPTAASMLLAGVVMKLGAYGALRVAVFLCPEGLTAYGGVWQWTVAILAVVGILYGAAVALVQKDFKFVIGFSSVSHMGFVLLGIASLHTIGLDGAVLQMFSHGIVASLLFAVVGRMVYERTHTRDLGELASLKLAQRMPFVAFLFVVGGLASMGLPGFSGFVAELQVLVGAWRDFPWLVIASGAGIVVTVWYTFRALLMAFYGDTPAPAPAHTFAPVTLPETLGALLLVFWLVFIGLYPRILLDVIDPSVQLLLSRGGS